MDQDIVISAEHLGKKYIIGHQQTEGYKALRDVLAQTFRNLTRSARDMLRGKAIIAGDELEEFWALKDVNFEVKRGEVVGIIGRNGAGKSTLLKVLSRITEPTEGRVTIRGRVASLLEVGTGFHPELTGRENIFLNGAILGMSRAEIKRKFDEIVDFAGVEKFLDTPVKRYSSGMYVRLAFAVAAHLEPEILVVDEVLAVGDAEFQKKCLGKMKDVAGHGRTVLFVSHNMGAIRKLCPNALLLEDGYIKSYGDAEKIVHKYMYSNHKEDTEIILDGANCIDRNGIKLIYCAVSGSKSGKNKTFRTGEEIEIQCAFEDKIGISNARLVLTLLNVDGDIVLASTDHNVRKDVVNKPGSYLSKCTIPAWLLNNGTYYLRIRFGVPGQVMLIEDTDLLTFSVEGPTPHGSDYDVRWPGVVCPKLDWKFMEITDK